MKHTSTPWHRNIPPATKYTTIWSGRNTHVLRLVVDGLNPEEVEANADFIVRACNSHDELAATLKEDIEWLSTLTFGDEYQQILLNERIRLRQKLLDQVEGRL